MAEFILPQNLGNVWASSGDVLKPSDSKIMQGWSAEIPPRQWFNWLDNRQDQAIAHIAQHGISSWIGTIEYQANKSYVQGSDGVVYKALTTNTNINPVGGASGNWQSAFISADQATKVASAAQSRAMTANDVYLSPLQLANSFTGTNQSAGQQGFQRYPGGMIEQWGISATIGANSSLNISYNIPFPNSVWNIQATLISSGPNAAPVSVGVFGIDNSTFRYDNRNTGNISASIFWVAKGN